MTDYSKNILKNFSPYDGIVGDPAVVQALSDMMNELDAAGFGRLVAELRSRFGAQGLDILFEAYICQMLRRNEAIMDLEYEPQDIPSPPDFRFILEGIRFDVQVKKLYAIGNAPDKEAFIKRFEERADRIAVPWFLNLWLSDGFRKEHVDQLFFHIQRGLKSFEPVSPEEALDFGYKWPVQGKELARFAFYEANDKDMPHIQIGVTQIGGDWVQIDGVEEPIASTLDVGATRKAVEKQLDASRKSLQRDPGPKQSNIVIMQPDSTLWVGRDEMGDVLYGDDQIVVRQPVARGGPIEPVNRRGANGLFRPDQFRKISGLILVPASKFFLDDDFEGMIYPQPLNLPDVANHPKPFPEMTFHLERPWGYRGTSQDAAG